MNTTNIYSGMARMNSALQRSLRMRQLQQNQYPVQVNEVHSYVRTITTGTRSFVRRSEASCAMNERAIKTLSSPHAVIVGNYSLFSSTSDASGTATTATATATASETNSVSSEEVSKFSSMASTWWQVDHNPLISMNPVRMSFITDQVFNHRAKFNDATLSSSSSAATTSGHPHAYLPLKGLKALDVGCGGGLLSESLARLGAKVTAIDPSGEVARAAQIHSQNSRDALVRDIDYRGGISVEDLAREYSHDHHNENLFDIVCVLEVIEHATDPRSLMKAAASLLKKPQDGPGPDDYDTDRHKNADGKKTSSLSPGGMLFVSTINRTAKSFGIAIVGGEYVTGKLPIGTHSWNKFLSPEEVNTLVREFHVEEVEKKGMILRPPFYDLRWYLDDEDYNVNWIGAYSYRQH